MAVKWTIECCECGKKEGFGDAKDIQFAKWKIIAWDVKTAEPKCICDKCEYGKPRNKD